MAFKVNDLMIQLPGAAGGAGGNLCGVDTCGPITQGGGCGFSFCGIDTCGAPALSHGGCGFGGFGVTHCGGGGITCVDTCAVVGITQGHCGPIGLTHCNHAGITIGGCAHAGITNCGGCSLIVSVCHFGGVTVCHGAAVTVCGVCSHAASICGLCSHGITHVCTAAAATLCGACSHVISFNPCAQIANTGVACGPATLPPVGCGVSNDPVVPFVDPNTDLETLKSQLQQALANVEAQQSAVNESLKPQTLEQVDQLEQQLRGALDELATRRTELQQKAATPGGGDTAAQGPAPKKPAG